MDSESRLSLLFVLESSPEDGNSIAFLNSYIDSLINLLADETDVTLFYPEFSDTEEHYSLNIIQGSKYKKMVTYLPARHESFKDTFANSRMENIFSYILKEERFDCVHIWSFKNHSFNYLFIAKERMLPVLVTVHDGFLFSNSVFSKGFPADHENDKVRISNFVNSSVTVFFKKMLNAVKKRSTCSSWFENIGRYSRYYNKTNLNPVDSFVFEERASLCEDVIKLTDRFQFFSQIEYNLFYRNIIPETQVFFLEQGIENDISFANRPFEIEGAVKFGFIGEILPEEGVLELVEAFNILYEDGYHNEMHFYGELHENHHYFTRLKKKVRNPNVYFHGPIQPGRLNSVLNTFDVLMIPSKWHRSDSFLVNNAISGRKAVIVSNRNNISEKIRRSNRGLILEQVDRVNIATAVSELERNRKRLYYFMRTTDDFKNSDIEDDVCTLVDMYSNYSRSRENFDRVLLKRKLIKKKIDRQRG
ncbi:MAG TPA: glycosyltransferase [bacterium]|nr:glycosyltransferase [bacterium]